MYYKLKQNRIVLNCFFFFGKTPRGPRCAGQATSGKSNDNQLARALNAMRSLTINNARSIFVRIREANERTSSCLGTPGFNVKTEGNVVRGRAARQTTSWIMRSLAISKKFETRIARKRCTRVARQGRGDKIFIDSIHRIMSLTISK